jgi:hypothetical protein
MLGINNSTMSQLTTEKQGLFGARGQQSRSTIEDAFLVNQDADQFPQFGSLDTSMLENLISDSTSQSQFIDGNNNNHDEFNRNDSESSSSDDPLSLSRKQNRRRDKERQLKEMLTTSLPSSASQKRTGLANKPANAMNESFDKLERMSQRSQSINETDILLKALLNTSDLEPQVLKLDSEFDLNSDKSSEQCQAEKNE